MWCRGFGAKQSERTSTPGAWGGAFLDLFSEIQFNYELFDSPVLHAV